jgi:hypothetical protein
VEDRKQLKANDIMGLGLLPPVIHDEFLTFLPIRCQRRSGWAKAAFGVVALAKP